MFPDALVPYSGALFSIPRRTNQGFYIELRSDTSTPTGVYNATVTVKDEDGDLIMQAPLSAEVLNVTFPEAPYNDTAVGIFSNRFYVLNGASPGTPEGNALYKQYYDYLLDHKLSGYRIPYDLLDPRAEENMSDPRVKSFSIPPSSNAGNGSWSYPGSAVGLNEPIPSLRLKNIADGLEDYDLLRMAEERLGRKYCLKKSCAAERDANQLHERPRKDRERAGIDAERFAAIGE